jgi:hypothetical protein
MGEVPAPVLEAGLALDKRIVEMGRALGVIE